MKEKIVAFSSAHSFLQDNEYIHSGYRLNFFTTKRILKSLFMYHNESFNVWSHLVGVILFLLLFLQDVSVLYTLKDKSVGLLKPTSLEGVMSQIYSEASIYEQKLANTVNTMYYDMEHFNKSEEVLAAEQKIRSLIQKLDSYDWIDPYAQYHQEAISKWPIFMFISTAILCMFMSSLYHLFSAYSPKVNLYMSKLDYAGISFLIMGSFYPLIYYAFYCQPGYVVMYLAIITVASLCVFVISLAPSFSSNEMKSFRGCLFSGLGISGVVPVVHLWLFYDISKFGRTIELTLMMGAAYLVGVAIYISKVPERFFPGAFDFWGNSHNIWHLFVIAGAVFHYFASIEAYHTRIEFVC